MSYADTATHQLMIRWSHLPIFPSIPSLATGAFGRSKTQSSRHRETEIRNDKERMSPTVQPSTLMKIYRQNTNPYPGYMAKLSVVCEE